MHDYKKLAVGQKARAIIPLVYRVTAGFPGEEKYVLVPQMRRSAHSIGGNLAEGGGRNTRGEFKQFVGYSIGSTYELEWHTDSSRDLGYLTPEDDDELKTTIIELKRMLYRFRESLR